MAAHFFAFFFSPQSRHMDRASASLYKSSSFTNKTMSSLRCGFVLLLLAAVAGRTKASCYSDCVDSCETSYSVCGRSGIISASTCGDIYISCKQNCGEKAGNCPPEPTPPTTPPPTKSPQPTPSPTTAAPTINPFLPSRVDKDLSLKRPVSDCPLRISTNNG